MPCRPKGGIFDENMKLMYKTKDGTVPVDIISPLGMIATCTVMTNFSSVNLRDWELKVHNKLVNQYEFMCTYSFTIWLLKHLYPMQIWKFELLQNSGTIMFHYQSKLCMHHYKRPIHGNYIFRVEKNERHILWFNFQIKAATRRPVFK